MNDNLRELAENGEWKDRAIELLEKATIANETTIREFVDDYWQNMASDESNIEAFREFETERMENN